MPASALDKILWGFKFRKRKSKEVSLQDFLRSIPFFENLSEKQLKAISQNLHERRYEENEYLFEVNHPGAALFIVMKGEVAVETPGDPGMPDSSVHQLALIQPGEFLGELALLDESPRSASARATKPTVVFALFRGDLKRLTKSEPEVVCEIYKTLAWLIGERLKATNRSAGRTVKAA